MNRMHATPGRVLRPVIRSPHRHALAALLALAIAAVVAAPAWSAGAGAGSGVVVNINTASAEELQALPGVGEARAAQIVALRKERGAFRKVDELLEVRGIGPAMLERLRPQVALSGKTRLGGASPKAVPTGKGGR